MKYENEEKRRTHEKIVCVVSIRTKHTIVCESSNSKTYSNRMK